MNESFNVTPFFSYHHLLEKVKKTSKSVRILGITSLASSSQCLFEFPSFWSNLNVSYLTARKSKWKISIKVIRTVNPIYYRPRKSV